MGKVIGLDYDIAKEHGVAAALLLNELSFWSNKKSRRTDGWIYKGYDELLERIPLSERTIRTAFTTLKAAGLITTKVMKVDGITLLHYRIGQYCRTGTAEIAEPIGTAEIAEPYIYTENTHNTGSDLVKKIFDLYVVEFKSPRTLLTDGRRKKIAARIKTYGFDVVEQAVRRTAASPFHRGENDRKWEADLDFIVRSDENVERLSNLKAQGRFTQAELQELIREMQAPETSYDRRMEIMRIREDNRRRYGNN